MVETYPAEIEKVIGKLSIRPDVFLCFLHQKICDPEFISAIRLRCQEKHFR